jgi:hypothetical protein
MLPGALEAENAALRSELGRRMEEVARLLELEGGQNQLLREQLDKRGVEVGRTPFRRNVSVEEKKYAEQSHMLSPLPDQINEWLFGSA